MEREQALKFVRSFLDVKDGVQEISRAVLSTIVSVAEHTEDRLRSICIETLAEICRYICALRAVRFSNRVLVVRDPPLLVAAGGIGPLTDALADGTYEVPESLVASFLYLLDMPRGRKYLRAGQGLEVGLLVNGKAAWFADLSPGSILILHRFPGIPCARAEVEIQCKGYWISTQDVVW